MAATEIALPAFRFADVSAMTEEQAHNRITEAIQKDRQHLHEPIEEGTTVDHLVATGRQLVTHPIVSARKIGNNMKLNLTGDYHRLRKTAQLRDKMIQDGTPTAEIDINQTRFGYDAHLGIIPSDERREELLTQKARELETLHELQGDVYSPVEHKELRSRIFEEIIIPLVEKDGNPSAARQKLEELLKQPEYKKAVRKMTGRRRGAGLLAADFETLKADLTEALDTSDREIHDINPEDMDIAFTRDARWSVHSGQEHTLVTKARELKDKWSGAVGEKLADSAAAGVFVVGIRAGSRVARKSIKFIATPIAGAASGAVVAGVSEYRNTNRDFHVAEEHRGYTAVDESGNVIDNFTGYGNDRTISAYHLLHGGEHIAEQRGKPKTKREKSVDELLENPSKFKNEIVNRYIQIKTRIELSDKTGRNLITYRKGNEIDERTELVEAWYSFASALDNLKIDYRNTEMERDIFHDLSHQLDEETLEEKMRRKERVKRAAIAGALGGAVSSFLGEELLRLRRNIHGPKTTSPKTTTTEPSRQPPTVIPPETTEPKITGGQFVTGDIHHGTYAGNLPPEEINTLQSEGVHVHEVVNPAHGEIVSNELGEPVNIPSDTEWIKGSTPDAWDLVAKTDHTDVFFDEAHTGPNGIIVYNRAGSYLGEHTMNLDQPRVQIRTTTNIVDTPQVSNETWGKLSTPVNSEEWRSAGGSQNELRTYKEGNTVVLDMRDIDSTYRYSTGTDLGGKTGFAFQRAGNDTKLWVDAPDGTLRLDPNDTTSTVNVNGTPMSMHDLAGILINKEKLGTIPDGDFGSERNGYYDVFRVGDGSGNAGFIEAAHKLGDSQITTSTIHGTGTPAGIETHTDVVQTQGPGITPKIHVYDVDYETPAPTTPAAPVIPPQTTTPPATSIHEAPTVHHGKSDEIPVLAGIVGATAVAGTAAVIFMHERKKRNDEVIMEIEPLLPYVRENRRDFIKRDAVAYVRQPLFRETSREGGLTRLDAIDLYALYLQIHAKHIHGPQKYSEADSITPLRDIWENDARFDTNEFHEVIQEVVHEKRPHAPPEELLRITRLIAVPIETGYTDEERNNFYENILSKGNKRKNIEALVDAYFRLESPSLYTQPDVRNHVAA